MSIRVFFEGVEMTLEEVRKEIADIHIMLPQMVGSLYPHILRARLAELQQKEKMLVEGKHVCDHDNRFKGTLGARNGCLACELENVKEENDELIAAIEGALKIASLWCGREVPDDHEHFGEMQALYKMQERFLELVSKKHADK